jgi:hypothetical protein
LQTSPRWLNAPNRTWDLDAILAAIREANSFIYIHVMDYVPMFVYQTPQQSVISAENVGLGIGQ